MNTNRQSGSSIWIMEWQPMYIMKTIGLIGKGLRWLVSRNFIGREESQRPSWSTNTTNRLWTWIVAWTWANYGMHHLTNHLESLQVHPFFQFFILNPTHLYLSVSLFNTGFLLISVIVTDEGCRAETSQVYCLCYDELCSLMSTIAYIVLFSLF